MTTTAPQSAVSARRSSARVLVVEDEGPIRTALGEAFRGAGYAVRLVADAATLEDEVDAFRPDLVLLDVMLPGRDGFAAARAVRARADPAILFVTARDGLDDRLRGFDLGGDDYVTKPFEVAELLARSKAALRRLGRVPATVELGDLVLDESAGVASRGGTVLDLTATEWRLLGYLAANRGRTLSKTQILTQVWGYDDYDPNLVEVYVSTLRRKLERHGPRLVHTVRGLGYVLKA